MKHRGQKFTKWCAKNMAFKVLIMGLPGAGKTTLAKQIVHNLESRDLKVIWLNADKIREEYNDWDFSTEGRIRQSYRMRDLADKIECDFAIADFVTPLKEMRDIFSADYTVWVDTITEGRFADTNKAFIPPTHYNIKVNTQDSEVWGNIITKLVLEQTWPKQQHEV
jgi:adenylylsulfate kinase